MEIVILLIIGLLKTGRASSSYNLASSLLGFSPHSVTKKANMTSKCKLWLLVEGDGNWAHRRFYLARRGRILFATQFRPATVAALGVLTCERRHTACRWMCRESCWPTWGPAPCSRHKLCSHLLLEAERASFAELNHPPFLISFFSSVITTNATLNFSDAATQRRDATLFARSHIKSRSRRGGRWFFGTCALGIVRTRPTPKVRYHPYYTFSSVNYEWWSRHSEIFENRAKSFRRRRRIRGIPHRR